MEDYEKQLVEQLAVHGYSAGEHSWEQDGLCSFAKEKPEDKSFEMPYERKWRFQKVDETNRFMLNVTRQQQCGDSFWNMRLTYYGKDIEFLNPHPNYIGVKPHLELWDILEDDIKRLPDLENRLIKALEAMR